jgi:hypothetical protein
MTVHTCIRCPLRFTNRAELADHLELDHGLTAQVLSPLAYPAAPVADPLYPSRVEDDVHTVLVVANQTLGHGVLADIVGRLIPQHDHLAVSVVVPATPSSHLPGPAGVAGPTTDGLDSRTDEAGLAYARWRLRTALRALADLGVQAHGTVGDPNPVIAVAAVVAVEPIDEIVLSTLDPALSRWLRADLPGVLGRRFGLPVTTMTAATAPRT